MPVRIGRRTPLQRRRLARTFIRQWREHRGLSQDALVARVRERIEDFSKSSLSRMENSKQPYSQPILEALAWALNVEPADLIMRDPDAELWSIVDNLKELPQPEQARIGAIIQTFRRVR